MSHSSSCSVIRTILSRSFDAYIGESGVARCTDDTSSATREKLARSPDDTHRSVTIRAISLIDRRILLQSGECAETPPATIMNMVFLS
jgi:hypothetical protein